MISNTGSNNAINSSLQKEMNSLLAEEVFKKQSKNSGDDNVVILKNKSENDIQLHKPNSEENPVIIKKSNDNVSYIKTKSNLADKKVDMPAIKYGEYQQKEEESLKITGKVSSIITSFDALAMEVGAVNDKISKEQLDAYLQSLQSQNSSDVTQEIAFVKNLIARFDTLSGGTGYITSYTGIKEPQDYKTVTKEQVTFPIDIRV